MANTHATLTSLFTDIADSIRAKKGTSGTIVADNFPSEIDAITLNDLLPSGLKAVDLGDLIWYKETFSGTVYFYSELADRKTSSYVNAVCSPPLTVSQGSISGAPTPDKTFNFLQYHTNKNLYVRYDEYADLTASEFKEAIKGIKIIYQTAS